MSRKCLIIPFCDDLTKYRISRLETLCEIEYVNLPAAKELPSSLDDKLQTAPVPILVVLSNDTKEEDLEDLIELIYNRTSNRDGLLLTIKGSEWQGIKNKIEILEYDKDNPSHFAGSIQNVISRSTFKDVDNIERILESLTGILEEYFKISDPFSQDPFL